MQIYDSFPYLEDEIMIIKKMQESDVDALSEITSNVNVYKYISPFLFNKSKKVLIKSINNLSGRDFDKKKLIIAGIYLKAEPDRLVGLAEMFDYKKRTNQITIGYRLNEAYWNRGIASRVVALLSRYLCNDIGINTLNAFVMPENIASAKVLLKNGFTQQDEQVQEKNWGGTEIVDLDVFVYTKA